MSKTYQKKTSRSRRKVQKLDKNAVKVDIADGQATFQMILPMNALMAEVAGSIEQMSSQAGLLMMKAMIDEEVSSDGPDEVADGLEYDGLSGSEGTVAEGS